MANTIELAKVYTNILDELYVKESVTSDLVSPPEVIRAGLNGNELLVPTLDVTGLADYSRNDGYVKGSVHVGWSTMKYEYDRGILFEVDDMDDLETFHVAAGRAAAELQRAEIAPEGDAYTFAKIAGHEGISKVAAGATFADGAEALAAINAAMSEMDEASVPEESRILYATPTVINSIRALDTNKSREVLDTFMKIVKVPQSRFYTAIDLKNYEGADEGGYAKAEDGADINFMIIEKSSVMAHNKHVVNHVIAPEYNNTGDGYIIKVRRYGIADVFPNKAAGIFLHHKAAV